MTDYQLRWRMTLSPAFGDMIVESWTCLRHPKTVAAVPRPHVLGPPNRCLHCDLGQSKKDVDKRKQESDKRRGQ